MKAIILIGGLGTRLRPFTCVTPKPLLPIANRPFLTYQLDLLRKHGIRDVILCTAYLPGIFKKTLGDGRRHGVRLIYVHEKVPLGTGGAIKNAERFVDQTTLIFNGDVLTDLNLRELIRFHRAKRANVTINLTRVEDPTAYGLVGIDANGRICRFLEKPSRDEATCNTINAGTYVFEPEVLERIPSKINYSVERGLFPHLLQEGLPLYGHVSKAYWLDIGTVAKYLKGNQDVLLKFCDIQRHCLIRGSVIKGSRSKIAKSAKIEGKLLLGDGAVIDEDVKIKGCVIVGHGCRIGAGTTLADSVIMDGCVIGKDCSLDKAVVGKKCRLEPNTCLEEGAAVGAGSLLTQYTRT